MGYGTHKKRTTQLLKEILDNIKTRLAFLLYY